MDEASKCLKFKRNVYKPLVRKSVSMVILETASENASRK